MVNKLNKLKVILVFLIIFSMTVSSGLIANAYSGEMGTLTQPSTNQLPKGSIVAMEAYGDNTAILMDDGSVWAWGDNSYRQLGEGIDEVQKYVFKPVRISGLEKTVGIAVGNGFILALDEKGQVWGLGNNSCNVLSNEKDTEKIAKPVNIQGLYDIQSITAGTNYAAAIKRDGTIWVWGEYRYKVDGSKRVIEIKKVTDVEKVFALRYNTIAIDKSGIGWICRGKQLDPNQITQVTGIVDVVEGVNFTYYVKNDGSVWAWNMFTSKLEQMEIFKDIKNIVGVHDDDFIVLDENGSAWSWINKTKKATKIENVTNAVSISAGKEHCAVLKNDNTIWSWGDNTYGQLGNGGEFFFSKPIMLESLKNMKQVAASNSFTVAVKEDGTLWTWGNNISGQLGNGTKEDSYTPMQVKGINDVEKVAVGNSHVLALKKDGSVWAWGSNLCGELGDGTYLGKQAPIQVVGINNAKDIAAGNGFSIAIKNNGSVWIWGNSGYGKDDDSAYKNRSVPAEIKDFNSAKMVSAGYDHGLALRADRNVWAWGSNGSGQYGYTPDDQDLMKRKAYRVPGVPDIMFISAGYNHNLAVRQNGTVIGWGNNDYGQLGVVKKEKSHGIYSKLTIGDFYNVTMVAAGKNHSFAIKEDGTLWAWGDNTLGQLGNEETISRSIPVQIVGMTAVKHITAGHGYSAAVKKDGTLWVWGSNIFGQLGIGKKSSDYENLPVKSLVN